jgi:hypothetical protein
MKKKKLILSALAVLVGIGSSVAESYYAGVWYTLTVGQSYFKWNTDYIPGDCGGTSNSFCSYWCQNQIGEKVTQASLISAGATGYNSGEQYLY